MTLNSPCTISVVIPCRNEEAYIEKCVRSVLGQVTSVPIEVLVVDGMSTDRTRSILSNLQNEFSGQVRIVDNPQHTTPYALNYGIRAARGSYVQILGAHSELLPNYIEGTYRQLQEHPEAQYAGGFVIIQGEGVWGQAISLSMSSKFCVGNSGYRIQRTPGYLDTIAFAMYRVEVFNIAGLFDSDMVRNQDDEFNYRLSRFGFKGFYDPAHQIVYYARQSVARLARQYYYYGFYKPLTYRKSRASIRLRHLIPAGFVTALGLAIVASAAMASWLPLAAVLVPYLLVDFAESSRLALRERKCYPLLLPIIFPAVHVSYGLGCLLGISTLFGKSQVTEQSL